MEEGHCLSKQRERVALTKKAAYRSNGYFRNTSVPINTSWARLNSIKEVYKTFKKKKNSFDRENGKFARQRSKITGCQKSLTFRNPVGCMPSRPLLFLDIL